MICLSEMEHRRLRLVIKNKAAEVAEDASGDSGGRLPGRSTKERGREEEEDGNSKEKK